MPVTTNFDLPYPASTDHVRLWEHLQVLAEATDTALIKPVFRARRAATQNFTTAVTAALSWDTEDIDTHGGHDLVTNPTRYTIPAGFGGYWQLGGGIGWGNGTAGRRGCFWRKNGADLDGASTFIFPNSAGTVSVPARPIVVQCAAGDYIELAGFQESGGTLGTTTTGSSHPSIDMAYLGPV